jgi:hypothetical protein
MCQIKTQPGQKPADVAIAEYNTYRDAHPSVYIHAAKMPVVLRVQLTTFIPAIDAPIATIKAQYEAEEAEGSKTITVPLFTDRSYPITEKQATCPTMKLALEMVADAIQAATKHNS